MVFKKPILLAQYQTRWYNKLVLYVSWKTAPNKYLQKLTKSIYLYTILTKYTKKEQ